MRRVKLLLTKKQKDNIALGMETIEMLFAHNPVCHGKPAILSKLETDVTNDIPIPCQPIHANLIQQKQFVLTVFKTDLSRPRDAICQGHKTARAFECHRTARTVEPHFAPAC